MDLFKLLGSLENNDDIHLARIIILLHSFTAKDGGSINGLTKLAKLDFLLRYPVYLEFALAVKGGPTNKVEIKEHERKSVESRMVRFRYGPWDYRYRRFINLLVSKGLAKVELNGKTIKLSLTENGMQIAGSLADQSMFADMVQRSKLLKRFFNQQGTTLMRFIYKTFPDIATLRQGEEIRK